MPGQGIGASAGGERPAPAPRGAARQLPLGLAMADRDGRLLFANPAFMRAAGREGRRRRPIPPTLSCRRTRAPFPTRSAVSRKARRRSGDIAVRLRTQPDDPVSLSLAGVRGLGEAAVLLGLTDTTEETRLKRQVAQATKMQAVGQLAGGVAHDFNNVLTAILGTCDLMLLRHTPGDSATMTTSSRSAPIPTAPPADPPAARLLAPADAAARSAATARCRADVSQMLRRLIGEKIQLTSRTTAILARCGPIPPSWSR
jgi:two-component system, cell cycle sensor histidine kinase and response regulator CckA